MPVDEFGERAELWVDMNSPVGRNNPGQLYETGLNRISVFAQKKIKETFEQEGVDKAFDVMQDWYNDVNPNYAKRISEVCITTPEKKGIVKDAIESGPKLWIPPFLNTLAPTAENQWNALENMKKWQTKWGAKSSRVRFKMLQADGTGREFVTDQEFAIGSKYIIHLHKIPEIFAPGPASVNHIGIPTKSTYETKYFPVSTNPYRFGEDELRVMAMDSDIREVTRFQNLFANSPSGVIKTIQSILLSESPTRIKRMPMSNGELAKNSAVLKLFHSITACLGVETKNTKIDPFDIPDELAESIHGTDIAGEAGNPINAMSDEETQVKRSNARKKRVDTMMAALRDVPDDDGESTDGV
jgi:hypothetical protein